MGIVSLGMCIGGCAYLVGDIMALLVVSCLFLECVFLLWWQRGDLGYFGLGLVYYQVWGLSLL